MLIAVIGGKLQGVEAVYLAKKAGFETLVIDKDSKAPAADLCDRFLQFEFSPGHPAPEDCPRVDLILPALEDMDVLTALKAWTDSKKIPLAFDLDAYTLSNSKLKSDLLFRKMNLPAPLPWPECGFPLVVKPDQASGSQGVEIFHDSKAFSFRFPVLERLDNTVIQEYIEGPSYSIEVVGRPGNYMALQVTDLFMDDVYDCKRVTAPTQLSSRHIAEFEEMAIAIAEEIRLEGIMDVEVVLNENKLKLLEIDARLPSQTPMAVYGSTGINMVEMLADLFVNQKISKPLQKQEQFAIVEHIRVSGSDIEVLGEHIMSQEGPLRLQTGFLGADEAVTSYAPGKHKWVGTMIFKATSRDEVNTKKRNCHAKIRERSNSIHEE